jgi:hypothetical protein
VGGTVVLTVSPNPVILGQPFVFGYTKTTADTSLLSLSIQRGTDAPVAISYPNELSTTGFLQPVDATTKTVFPVFANAG